MHTKFLTFVGQLLIYVAGAVFPSIRYLWFQLQGLHSLYETTIGSTSHLPFHTYYIKFVLHYGVCCQFSKCIKQTVCVSMPYLNWIRQAKRIWHLLWPHNSDLKLFCSVSVQFKICLLRSFHLYKCKILEKT